MEELRKLNYGRSMEQTGLEKRGNAPHQSDVERKLPGPSLLAPKIAAELPALSLNLLLLLSRLARTPLPLPQFY